MLLTIAQPFTDELRTHEAMSSETL